MNKNVMLSSSIVILDLGLFIGWSRSRSRLLAGVGAGAGLSILRLRTPVYSSAHLNHLGNYSLTQDIFFIELSSTLPAIVYIF